MKLKAKISDITHADLVELFSTALYSSSWLGCNLDYNYPGVKKEDGDCYEDIIAKALLAGNSVELFDMYGTHEDDDNGSKLPHYFNDERECLCYSVSLGDIYKGLEKMMQDKHYCRYVVELMDSDDGDFDQPQAECIIQFILWGEVVY